MRYKKSSEFRARLKSHATILIQQNNFQVTIFLSFSLPTSLYSMKHLLSLIDWNIY